MTLCDQYTDNMKKRTLAQNGTKMQPKIHNVGVNSDGQELFHVEMTGTYQGDFRWQVVKGNKRPRGKKVFSTDKMVRK
jgi:hypothetical protein